MSKVHRKQKPVSFLTHRNSRGRECLKGTAAGSTSTRLVTIMKCSLFFSAFKLNTQTWLGWERVPLAEEKMVGLLDLFSYRMSSQTYPPKVSAPVLEESCSRTSREQTTQGGGKTKKWPLCPEKQSLSILLPLPRTSVCLGKAAHTCLSLCSQWTECASWEYTTRGCGVGPGRRRRRRACISLETKGWVGQVYHVLGKHVLQGKSFYKGPETCLQCNKSAFLVGIFFNLFLIVNIQVLFHNVTTRKFQRLNDFLTVLIIWHVVISVKGRGSLVAWAVFHSH